VAASEKEDRFGGMPGAETIFCMVEDDWLRATKNSASASLTETCP